MIENVSSSYIRLETSVLVNYKPYKNEHNVYNYTITTTSASLVNSTIYVVTVFCGHFISNLTTSVFYFLKFNNAMIIHESIH